MLCPATEARGFPSSNGSNSAPVDEALGAKDRGDDEIDGMVIVELVDL